MPKDVHELFPPLMLEQAREVVDICRRRGLTIATAESCTGGLLSGILTEIPGASEMFTHGFITYANPAKIMMVDVPEGTIASHGAVSEETARAMAEGARRTSGASFGIAITGISGPGGGTPGKPVGTVHVACAYDHKQTMHAQYVFDGERTCIRLKSVEAALAMLLKRLEVI